MTTRAASFRHVGIGTNRQENCSGSPRLTPSYRLNCWIRQAGAVCDSSGMLLALLRQYVRPYRWPVAAVMGFQTSTLAALYLPTVNAAIIDEGVAVGDTAVIARLGLLMLIVTALQGC